MMPVAGSTPRPVERLDAIASASRYCPEGFGLGARRCPFHPRRVDALASRWPSSTEVAAGREANRAASSGGPAQRFRHVRAAQARRRASGATAAVRRPPGTSVRAVIFVVAVIEHAAIHPRHIVPVHRRQRLPQFVVEQHAAIAAAVHDTPQDEVGVHALHRGFRYREHRGPPASI
jgi:hypothetical protein